MDNVPLFSLASPAMPATGPLGTAPASDAAAQDALVSQLLGPLHGTTPPEDAFSRVFDLLLSGTAPTAQPMALSNGPSDGAASASPLIEPEAFADFLAALPPEIAGELATADFDSTTLLETMTRLFYGPQHGGSAAPIHSVPPGIPAAPVEGAQDRDSTTPFTSATAPAPPAHAPFPAALPWGASDQIPATPTDTDAQPESPIRPQTGPHDSLTAAPPATDPATGPAWPNTVVQSVPAAAVSAPVGDADLPATPSAPGTAGRTDVAPFASPRTAASPDVAAQPAEDHASSRWDTQSSRVTPGAAAPADARNPGHSAPPSRSDNSSLPPASPPRTETATLDRMQPETGRTAILHGSGTASPLPLIPTQHGSTMATPLAPAQPDLAAPNPATRTPSGTAHTPPVTSGSVHVAPISAPQGRIPTNAAASPPQHPTQTVRTASTTTTSASAGITPVQIVMPQREQDPTTTVPDLDPLPELAASEASRPGSPASLTTGASANNTLAQQIARQIATAMPAPGGQPVELRLNPEELGRVNLSLLQSDATITVTILAERGETLDLMRRHIALLEGEFRDMGFDDIQFAFGSSGGGSADPDADTDNGADPTTLLASADNVAPPSDPTVTLSLSDGLDLRL